MKTGFWRRALKRIALAILIAVGVSVAYFEFGHRYNYGHFVPYGLHMDVTSRNSSIGIPGQEKMYEARLSNFMFWPVSLQACDYMDDAFGRGTMFPYAVQRWDREGNKWSTIVETSEAGFCRPVPLSVVEAKPTSKRLWPGMEIQVVEGEATGAREPFKRGDLARFVVFRNLAKDLDLRNATASAAFVIEDEVVRDGTQFRVTH
ncbi:MAG TPA: hypothetical protein VF251_03390 [Pyrinomonadaceae bacterium]